MAAPLPDHPQEPAEEVRLRQCLSALADGRSDALDEACRLWRDEGPAGRAWHSYHLIGDVLRSDELARSPARDVAFLASFRERLAAEPVLLAPEPEPLRVSVPATRQRWVVPAAMAAGFVLVAGVLVVTRIGLPDAAEGANGGATLAGASAGAEVRPADRSARPQATLPDPGGSAVLRSPGLDEYLRAHQSARVVVAPGGTLRRVDTAVPAGNRQ